MQTVEKVSERKPSIGELKEGLERAHSAVLGLKNLVPKQPLFERAFRDSIDAIRAISETKEPMMENEAEIKEKIKEIFDHVDGYTKSQRPVIKMSALNTSRILRGHLKNLGIEVPEETEE